ncbi:hypothetical protein C8T65DRAFT_642312 [Cerioporus squamosus]|nr:hypothetical protein C8T65DRAFT_642312 [Cerioporus squamosus]
MNVQTFKAQGGRGRRVPKLAHTDVKSEMQMVSHHHHFKPRASYRPALLLASLDF